MHGLTWVTHPNGISMGSAVFKGLTYIRHTDRRLYSVCSNRPHVARPIAAMWPKTKLHASAACNCLSGNCNAARCRLSYFGSTTGMLLNVPNVTWSLSSNSSTYDFHCRQWYRQAATSAKNVVLLLDPADRHRSVSRPALVQEPKSKAPSTPATMSKQPLSKLRSTFVELEATFDFVATNGNNVERFYCKISSFRHCRMKCSACSVRQCCFDIVASMDGA